MSGATCHLASSFRRSLSREWSKRDRLERLYLNEMKKHKPDAEDDWLDYEAGVATTLAVVPAGYLRDHFLKNAKTVQRIARELFVAAWPEGGLITPSEAISIASKLVCLMATVGASNTSDWLTEEIRSTMPKPIKVRRPVKKQARAKRR